MMKKFRDRIDFDYEIILILLGGNDVQTTSKADLYYYWRSVVNIVKFLNKNAQVLLATPLPRMQAETSMGSDPVEIPYTKGLWTYVQKACKYTGAVPFDFHKLFLDERGQPIGPLFRPDGIHLTKVGKARLANAYNWAMHSVQRTLV